MSKPADIPAEMRRLREENRRLQAERDVLDAENEVLRERIAELVDELARVKDADRQLELALELKVLNERLRQKNREVFGTKSERRGRPDDQDAPAKKPRKKRSKTGRTPQPKLHVEVVKHTFDEPDLCCPRCAHAMRIKVRKAGFQHIQLRIREYFIEKHEVEVASCGSCGFTESAETPVRWNGNSNYSLPFTAQVAYDKYGLHQPLARQEREMRRQGVTVGRNTLAGLTQRLGELLTPTYQALHRHILTQPVVHADETTWRMTLGKGGSSTWWVWLATVADASFFLVQPSRGKQAAERLLPGFDGTLVADGLGSYASLARLADRRGDLGLSDTPLPNFDLAGCWAHARRPLIAATEQADAAHEGLDLIAELFAIEARVRDAHGDANDETLLAARREARERESRPVVEALYAWVDRTRALPSTKLDDGLRYLRNHRAALTVFLDDPRVPLTNNLAEQVLRTAVLGRKNHQGSRSEGGARVSGIFYSIMQTCRLVDVDPVAFMITVAERAAVDPTYALLPHVFARELDASERGPPEG